MLDIVKNQTCMCEPITIAKDFSRYAYYYILESSSRASLFGSLSSDQ